MIPSSTGCVQSIWNRRVVFFFLPLPDCCLAGRLLPFVCKEFKSNLVWVLHPVNQYSYNICMRVRIFFFKWIIPACQHIWACAKRCSARTIHFFIVNSSSCLSFLWTNLTLSKRVCIKEIIKINLTPSVSFGVSKIWKFTPSPGRKSAEEGWTFRVHCFSCRFVCIFLLQAIFPLLPHRT